MAVDKEIQVKVSIDPFEEMDKKKSALMTVKEVGLKLPKRVDFSGKFSVTTSKWDKKKLEAQTRILFRYDLSLFASQVWQDFVPFQKAKNGQDKFKAKNAFIKAVPKLQKAMEKKLKEKFEEFQEDIASGAADDLGALKGTRKGLSSDRAEKVAELAVRLRDWFDDDILELRELKAAEVRASGAEKAKATEELNKALSKALGELSKKTDAVFKGADKMLGPIRTVPNSMVKSLKKDMSDAAKTEYKKSAVELAKALKPLETQIGSGKKAAADVLSKMKRKDFSKSTIDLIWNAMEKINDTSAELYHTINDIDAKLKKLEQAVKKR